ncbi:predicted protein [Naegleria gruberi]|uniref:Predicted protein n=1 Tax=Naegleria gruberi TaxID=5762 RepID=D2VPA8_NAEGR|nr:uncharacterized protein NAEGRDRAFT_70789 [Naegleria gruberi]EFC41325.1 predicted protein [Naegleria gruberi]|eukprot:XP_002674069.1 predicted protein [Naegleria gruberi strain NEG-M]
MSRRLKDYYGLLSVARNATQSDIKKAYVKLAKLYHPDLHDNNDPKFTSKQEMFKEITEAYSILNNPRKRSVYNTELYEVEKATNLRDGSSVPLEPKLYEMSAEEKEALGKQIKKIRFRKVRRLFIIVLALFVIGWYAKFKYIFLRMYNRDIGNKVIFKDKEGVDAEVISEVNRRFSAELARVREEREKQGILRQPTKKMGTAATANTNTVEKE